MLNKIIVQGRCCREVELRRTASGNAVASVSIACERDVTNSKTGERETDFLDIVAFGKTGEFLAKWFTKGSMVITSGRLQIRSWTDKDGNKRRSAEVVADNVYFGDSKKSDNGTSSYTPSAPVQDFAPINDDDGQLPF